MPVPTARRPAGCWALLVALGIAAGCGSGGSDPAANAAALAGDRLREILARPDPIRRATGVGGVLSGLAPEALPTVLEAFKASPLDGLDTEFVLLANWWGRFDPDAALAWATRDPRATSYAVIAGVYRSWAQHDPQAAWASARRLPQLSIDPGQAAVIAGWDESGQPGLLEFVQGLPAGVERQRVSSLLARRRVLALGAQGAVTWAESLPAGDFQRELELRVAGEAAWFDPVGIASWAEPRIAAAQRPTGLPSRIATRWVRLENPADAMAWLSSLPAGDDRHEGVLEGFRDWLATDSEAAAAWLDAQELEPWLEPAFALYAQSFSLDRPEEAMERLWLLSNEGLRNGFAVRMLRWWHQRDPEAADAWMAQAELPEGMRERAKGPPRGPRRGRRTAS